MYRTLSELRDSVNRLIATQGEDAACAAFIFTKEDVFEFDGESNEIDDYFPTLFSNDVLADVGECSYIYEQVGELIADSIQNRKRMTIYNETSN